MLAFAVWNISSRTPLEVVRDARHAFATRRGLFAGCVAAIAGVIFVAAATVLVYPALPLPARDFGAVELATLLIALALDHLIGDDVRAVGKAREPD